jgi:uncharacterized HAD superfamily protein/adenine/guanine phosphoribosyltransferase-like PRPP-binding protein
MNYRSIADLSDVISRNLYRLPSDVDLVVGVPRSGLLAAAIMALALNVQFTDVEGFLTGRLFAAGKTRRRNTFDRSLADMSNIVVVDDSIFSGESMAETRAKIEAAYPEKKITFCAVYGVRSDQPGVDIAFEVVPHPRLFQWNLFHHNLLEQCCVDIDGVLCVDPTDDENDDGKKYIQFLLEANAMHTPTKKVGYLVTSRLEKYRTQTETWLQRRGIKYGELIMLDLPTKEERQRLNAHGHFKGTVFRHADALLFIESDRLQAAEIAKISGKPALCVETQELFSPSSFSGIALLQKAKQLPRRQGVKILARRILGPTIYGTLKSAMKR